MSFEIRNDAQLAAGVPFEDDNRNLSKEEGCCSVVFETCGEKVMPV
jgi:hypothetical protein